LKDEIIENETQKDFEKAVEKSKKGVKNNNSNSKNKPKVEQIDVDQKLEDKFNTI
jgi:hypothetical protein